MPAASQPVSEDARPGQQKLGAVSYQKTADTSGVWRGDSAERYANADSSGGGSVAKQKQLAKGIFQERGAVLDSVMTDLAGSAVQQELRAGSHEAEAFKPPPQQEQQQQSQPGASPPPLHLLSPHQRLSAQRRSAQFGPGSPTGLRQSPHAAFQQARLAEQQQQQRQRLKSDSTVEDSDGSSADVHVSMSAPPLGRRVPQLDRQARTAARRDGFRRVGRGAWQRKKATGQSLATHAATAIHAARGSADGVAGASPFIAGLRGGEGCFRSLKRAVRHVAVVQRDDIVTRRHPVRDGRLQRARHEPAVAAVLAAAVDVGRARQRRCAASLFMHPETGPLYLLSP